jgi:putative selenate reductase
VVVIGGGKHRYGRRRAARRIPGVEHVRLVYRRTRRYMPADEDELALALADGVEFLELLSLWG